MKDVEFCRKLTGNDEPIDGPLYEDALAVRHLLVQPIDFLIFRVSRELGIPIRKHLIGGLTVPKALAIDLGLAAPTLNRIKKEGYKIPLSWIVKLHLYSGIPLEECFAIAGQDALAYPHPNAKTKAIKCKSQEQQTVT